MTMPPKPFAGLPIGPNLLWFCPLFCSIALLVAATALALLLPAGWLCHERRHTLAVAIGRLL